MQMQLRMKGNKQSIHLRPQHRLIQIGFALSFMLAGAWFAWAIGRNISLECPPSLDAQCTLRRAVVFGEHEQRIPVGTIIGARVDTVTSGISASMLLVVETTAGDLPIDLVAADGQTKQLLRDELIAFAANPASGPFAIIEHRRAIGLGFGVVVAMAGVVILMFLESVVLTIDPSTQEIVLRSRRRGRSATRRLVFSEVRGVSRYAFRYRSTQSFGVELLLTKGRRMPITHGPTFTDDSSQALMTTMKTIIPW